MKAWHPFLIVVGYGAVTVAVLVSSKQLLDALGASPSDFAFWFTALVEGFGFLGLGIVEIAVHLSASAREEQRKARIRIEDIQETSGTAENQGSISLQMRNTGGSAAIGCRILVTLISEPEDEHRVRQFIPWEVEKGEDPKRIVISPNAPALAHLLELRRKPTGEACATLPGSSVELDQAKYFGWIDLFSQTSLGESQRVEVGLDTDKVTVTIDREPFTWPASGNMIWSPPKSPVTATASFPPRAIT